MADTPNQSATPQPATPADVSGQAPGYAAELPSATTTPAESPSAVTNTQATPPLVAAPRSIKTWTVEQVFEVIEYLQKSWVVVAFVVGGVYSASSYFATSAALRQLRCDAERSTTEENHAAHALVLNSQKTAAYAQLESMQDLQAWVLKIQRKNPRVDLSPLEGDIGAKISAARQAARAADEEINKAQEQRAAALSAAANCERTIK